MVDALIGQKIGRYEIIERIGHGGMSEVFKACCSDDGSYVAVKLLHSFHADDPSFIHRFTREARAMSQLDHPSIVHVYDFDTKIETVPSKSLTMANMSTQSSKLWKPK